MDITMPQLGETVTEGTITRWLKRVGERIEADEPLFEVSTDKVDSEVPAASAGFLTEIRVPEGETAPVGAVLAVIGAEPGATAPAPPAPEPVTRPEAFATPVVPVSAAAPVAPAPRRRRRRRSCRLRRSRSQSRLARPRRPAPAGRRPHFPRRAPPHH